MKIYGLLGRNIGYSLSPAMHNAGFKKLKIDAEYRIFDTKPEGLDDFLKSFLRSGISGLNVTVPYKQEAHDFINKYGAIDDGARKTGAVNTIVIKNKSLLGYNTDGPGFMMSLKKDLMFNPKKKNIIIFGAGGAGTTAALELARYADKIKVLDTDARKIAAFKKRFLEYYPAKKLDIVGKGADNVKKAMRISDLAVNATPFGRKAGQMLIKPEFLHKGLKVFDLIYNPPVTPFIKAARGKGLKAVNGLGMLLYQGAAAFKLWTGRKAPLETMRAALKKASYNKNVYL